MYFEYYYHHHQYCHRRCVTFQWVIYSKIDRKFSGIVFHVAFLVHKVEFNYCETVCDVASFWCLSGWLHSTTAAAPVHRPPNNSWESNFIQLGLGACLLARFRFFVSIYVNLAKPTNKPNRHHMNLIFKHQNIPLKCQRRYMTIYQ